MRVDVTVERADGQRRDEALLADAATSTDAVAELLGNSIGLPSGTEPLVDGTRLDAATHWTNQIRTGSVVCAIAPAPTPGATMHVICVAGPDVGTVHNVAQRMTVVGRDQQCDIALDDPEVSRRHALLVTDGATVQVEDLSSTNGVWVAGRRINARTALDASQVVRLGNTVLRVETGAPACPADAHAPAPPEPNTDRAPIIWPTPPTHTRTGYFPVASSLASVGAALAVGVVLHSTQFLLIGMIAPAVVVVAAAVTWWRGHREARRGRRDYAASVQRTQSRILEAIGAEAVRRRRARPDAVQLARRTTCSEHADSRSGDLRVRIGMADQPSDVMVVHAGVATSAGMTPLVPLELDLDADVTYLAGDRGSCRGLASWIVLQLCAASSPRDLEVVLVADADRDEGWTWTRWLPHLAGGRPVRCAPHLAASQRRKRVLVLDSLSTEEILTEVLRHSHADAVVVIAESGAPPGCVSLTTTADGLVDLRNPRHFVRAVSDGVPADLAERIARRLSATNSTSDVGTQSSEADTLLQLSGDDTLDGISRRWEASSGGARTVIGRQRGRPFEIDLLKDGPHALIVGTTGSGKSELLQTLVAGLALNHPPDELSFALIDYKGGATFAALAELPHVTSVLTDLDGAAAARALVSLHAELRRRESLFATARVGSLDDYRTLGALPRIPRLVIVVDELAAFIEQQAELSGNLRSIAARGRSLGLHLVLATQRAGSVVPADIRSNANLRIALRMAEAADSRELVGTGEAADIGADTPGAAVVRGAEGVTRIQVARVSVASAVPANAQLVALGPWRSLPSASSDCEVSDLSRIVSSTRDTAAAKGLVRHCAPWLPALPTTLPTEQITFDGPPTTVPFGLADLPEQQLQQATCVDLRAGAAAVIAGGPRSGRTTALATIAHAAADRLAPSELVIHVVDAAGGGLVGATGALPHVGTAVTADDPAVVARLVERLGAEVHTRQGRSASAETQRPGPFALLLVDGRENLARRMDAFDNGRTTHALSELVDRGPSVGISAVATGELSAALNAAAGRVDVYALGDGASTVARTAPMSNDAPMPSGRGVRRSDGAIVQIALHDGRAARLRWPATADVADRIVVRALPTSITTDELTAPHGHFVLGVGGDEARVISVDLVGSSTRMLISGPPSAGKSTTLISLLDQAMASGLRVCVAADRRSPLTAAAASFGLSTVTPDETRPPIDCRDGLLLVDDVDRFIDTAAEDALTAVIAEHERALRRHRER